MTLICLALTILMTPNPMQQPALGQGDQKPTFRGGVDLVTVSVLVQDRNGRLVTNLSLLDFDVIDAGERRPIAEFRSEPTPMSIAVLFDISGSMNVARKLASARDAVKHLVNWLNPGVDQIALFAFDAQLQELQPFTPAPSNVPLLLDSIRPFGSTSLYDAIAQTGRRLAAHGGTRRAVVVVTDGIDNQSQLTASEVSGIASAIDVPVYILAVVSPLDHADGPSALNGLPDSMPAGPLNNLANWTGGAFFLVSAPAHASTAARQIVTELRQQYLIAFEPSARAGWHPLEIHTRDTRLTVRARSGYIAGPRTIGQN